MTTSSATVNIRVYPNGRTIVAKPCDSRLYEVSMVCSTNLYAVLATIGSLVGAYQPISKFDTEWKF